LTTSNVQWSCSAQIDLLGFSNHLMVANWDIRTETGNIAIERLTALEEALRLLDKEKARYPELYPNKLNYTRFNDALFLGIDAEYLSPPNGQTTLSGGYNIKQLRKMFPKKDKEVFKGTPTESGSEVAKFLGLVARIHQFINEHELEKSFPGCRTVVVSGLRKCFSDRKKDDDFFSANFSVSTAFKAEQMGSSVGLKGNNLYVEDDVSTAISYCKPCHAILGFSKFIRLDSPLVNPYQYQHVEKCSLSIPRSSWTVREPISLDILKKPLTFRLLNPSVLTNLQLYKDYQQMASKTVSEQLEKQIKDSLSSSTPTLEEVNKTDTVLELPFLSLRFGLDEDYSSYFPKG
jgi:hypothetical protein